MIYFHVLFLRITSVFQPWAFIHLMMMMMVILRGNEDDVGAAKIMRHVATFILINHFGEKFKILD